jgi:type IX secretion system PorP/SprF family membrane protein
MKYITLLFIFLPLACFTQDINFSQTSQSKIFYNPAFAGSDQTSNLILGHKNYSPTKFGNYLSSQASYNQKLEVLHGGFGAQIINDRQGSGAFNRIFGSLMYSYHFKAQKNIFLYAGLESKFGYLSYNIKDFIFPNMFDPVRWELNRNNQIEHFHSQSDQYVEFNTGLLMVYKNYMLRTFNEFSIGLAVHHLNKPTSMLNPNKTGIPRKYNFYFDIDIPLMRQKKASNIPLLTPMLFVEAQNTNMHFQYGGIIHNNDYRFGAFARHNKLFHFFQLIFYAGFNFSNYSLSYSYDGEIFNNMEKNIFSGAHEVTFTINFQYKGKD